ncbi:MAG: hypothetical protein HZB16_14325 [Armatimonadetes bacterium]|nr:hypothetical protein [Armatimonadota bacterium]
MLKLQLLDRRFFEARKVTQAMILCAILTVGVVGFALWRTTALKTKVADMKNQASAAAAFEQQITAKQGEIEQVKAEVAPFDAQLAYVKSLLNYSDNFPKYLRMLSRYIFNRAEVLSVALTGEGFTMQVRTKGTQDVAGLMINLKQAYKAGLIATDSLSIQGLSGWPNPTSPRGWGPDTRRRIELPFSTGDLQGVNSSSRTLGAVTGVTGGGAAPGGPGGPGSSGGSGGPGMSAPGPSGPPGGSGGSPGGMPSAAPGGSGGSGGAAPGAGGPGAAVASAGGLRSLQGLNLETTQFFTNPQDAAHRQFIQASDDPPLQPYLNLVISGRWGNPFPSPAGGAAAGGGGGMPGMPGMSGGAPGMPGGSPGGPPAPPPGSPGGPGTPAGGPSGSR